MVSIFGFCDDAKEFSSFDFICQKFSRIVKVAMMRAVLVLSPLLYVQCFVPALRRVSGGRVVSLSSGLKGDQVWQIEEDSSEIEAKSSADIAREKAEAARLEMLRLEAERLEKERIEAEKKRVEEEKKRLEEEQKKGMFARPDVMATTSPVSPTASSDSSKGLVPSGSPEAAKGVSGLSQGNFGAFDVGLLIAFPVIVGTLMLFFIFPFLGPQFAESLPPVPLN